MDRIAGTLTGALIKDAGIADHGLTHWAIIPVPVLFLLVSLQGKFVRGKQAPSISSPRESTNNQYQVSVCFTWNVLFVLVLLDKERCANGTNYNVGLIYSPLLLSLAATMQ